MAPDFFFLDISPILTPIDSCVRKLRWPDKGALKGQYRHDQQGMESEC